MKNHELTKKLIEELQETKELYNNAITEYDVLMNFLLENDLTKELDDYIYEQLKDCKDEELMDCLLRLITHEPEETKQPTVNIGSEVYINGVRVK